MPILDQKYRLLELLRTDEVTLAAEANYQARFNLEVSRSTFKKISSFNRDADRWNKIRSHEKQYPQAETIELNAGNLPSESPLNDAQLKSTILKRHATRGFSGGAMTLATLSELLTVGYGKNPRRADAEHGRHAETQRTVASGGCRLPVEIYAVIIHVEGVPNGFYHYNINKGRLALIEASANPAAVLRKAGFDGDRVVIERAAVALILTGVFDRTTMKYGPRGNRFVHLDAGHIGQNIWLTATGLGLECTAYGGGFDSEIAKLLKLNQSSESLLLSYLIGAPTL